MTNTEIEQKVQGILAKKLDLAPDKITPQSRLAEDLGLDSFGGVELMFELEEAFGLNIPDADIENIRTVNDTVAYLATFLQAKPAT